MTELSRPAFVEYDPDEITRQLVAAYESIVGKTLHPAQPERLFIDVIAYRECLMRQAIQEAAEQNLIAYARDAALDHLGANVGVARLDAKPASCTVEFCLSAAPVTDDVIAAGVELVTGDGVFTFTTVEDCIIGAGESSGTCRAQCTATGTDANGYMTASLRLAAPVSTGINSVSVITASNTTVTALGTEPESDDEYRTRLPLALEAFSSAGPELAYRYHALNAHSSIIDVSVTSPEAGRVLIYPLCKDGEPSQAVLDLVYSACNGEKVRPLTDMVQVLAPIPREFTVQATVNLYGDADRNEVLTELNRALAAYRDEIKTSMGRDVVPTQIIALLHIDGVYSVELTAPSLIHVEPQEYPVLTGWTINVGAVLYE